jgi:hypothetical protein
MNRINSIHEIGLSELATFSSQLEIKALIFGGS